MKIYDDLYLFYITAKSPSLSAAAKKMGADLSSLSCAISRLEKRLNKKLLIRKRTGLELTESGTALYQRISTNYSNLSSLISEYITTDLSTDYEEIKILTTTGVLATLLVNVIEKFKNDFPTTLINLETYDGPVNFTSTNADIGILPTVIDADNVNKKKVATLTSQMFCSEIYREKYGEPQSLDELKKHTFIGYYNSSTGYKGNVDWHLKYSKTGEADIKINLASAQIYAAEKGLGILAIPREMPMSQHMIPLFPERSIAIDVFTITRRDEKNSKVDTFVEYVKKYIVNKEKKNEKT